MACSEGLHGERLYIFQGTPAARDGSRISFPSIHGGSQPRRRLLTARIQCSSLYNAFKEIMRTLRSTITDRGQTTIPAAVRKALKLKPRQLLTYEIQTEGVLIRPETENLMDLAGCLKSKVPAGMKAEERKKARETRLGRYL